MWTQFAEVADARGQPGMVEVIEQRDRELARRVEHVAVDRGGDLAIGLEALGQPGPRSFERAAIEIEIGRDFDHAPLAFHRGQQGADAREFRRRQRERLE